MFLLVQDNLGMVGCLWVHLHIGTYIHSLDFGVHWRTRGCPQHRIDNVLAQWCVCISAIRLAPRMQIYMERSTYNILQCFVKAMMH